MRHGVAVGLETVGFIALLGGFALGVASVLTAIDRRREKW